MSRYLIGHKPIIVKNKVMPPKKESSKTVAINFLINNSNERLNWMNSLLYLSKEKIFVDGVIVTLDHKKFYIDRNIFAAISPYFRALFVNSLCPAKPVHEVFLPDISSDVMQILVDFVYTGQLIGVTQLNIERLIQASDRLQIVGALDYCNQYMIQAIDVNNCIRIFQLSRLYYSPDVIEKSKLFILHNFSTIKEKSTDFLRLTFKEMEDILSDDRLNVLREEITYEAIAKWVSNNTQRIENFNKLLRFVRFGNSQVKFIESIVSENVLVKTNEDLKSYIECVCIVLNDLHSNPLPSKFDIYLYPFLRPRIPKDIIFVYGGWSAASATNQLETYDCRVNKWFTIKETLIAFSPYRAYHGMIYFNGLVYIIGGFDGRQHYNTLKAFDPRAQVWSNKACMHIARCYVSVALCDQMIYAMGGFDGTARTNSAERYNYKENQWEFVANMNYQRSDACAASLQGKIYIVGGFNGSEVLNTAEVYDPLNNEWTIINGMNRPRSGVQLVQYDCYIYAIGGNDGIARQTSIEKYDPKRNVWTLQSNMRTARSNFASVVLENQIYVMGGFNACQGMTTISDVEAYDPKTNCWQELWKMNLHRSALSTCVVNELENGQQYTWLRRELTDNYSNVILNRSSKIKV